VHGLVKPGWAYILHLPTIYENKDLARTEKQMVIQVVSREDEPAWGEKSPSGFCLFGLERRRGTERRKRNRWGRTQKRTQADAHAGRQRAASSPRPRKQVPNR